MNLAHITIDEYSRILIFFLENHLLIESSKKDLIYSFIKDTNIYYHDDNLFIDDDENSCYVPIEYSNFNDNDSYEIIFLCLFAMIDFSIGYRDKLKEMEVEDVFETDETEYDFIFDYFELFLRFFSAEFLAICLCEEHGLYFDQIEQNHFQFEKIVCKTKFRQFIFFEYLACNLSYYLYDEIDLDRFIQDIIQGILLEKLYAKSFKDCLSYADAYRIIDLISEITYLTFNEDEDLTYSDLQNTFSDYDNLTIGQS